MEETFEPNIDGTNTQQESNAGMPRKPQDYMTLSIIVTLLCCLPFGIVAVVKASKVDSLWYTGQYDAAFATAEQARKWCIIGLCFGAAAYILFAILTILALATGLYVD